MFPIGMGVDAVNDTDPSGETASAEFGVGAHGVVGVHGSLSKMMMSPMPKKLGSMRALPEAL